MKSNSPKKLSLLGATSAAFALSAFALPTLASADIIFRQSFDYGNLSGNFTTIGADDWSAPASGARDATYNNESLTYSGITSSGGSIQTNSTWGSQAVMTQTLGINISDKSEVWVSALFAIDTATPGNDRYASIGLAVKQNSWDNAVTRNVGKLYGQNTGYAVSGSPNSTALTDGDFATHGTSTVHIVYRLAEGSAAEFWVNPGQSAIPGSGQLIGSTIQNLTSLDSLTIRFLGLSMRIDEFVVADRYSDIYAVPEPAHIALIGGAAALGLVIARRKRKVA